MCIEPHPHPHVSPPFSPLEWTPSTGVSDVCAADAATLVGASAGLMPAPVPGPGRKRIAIVTQITPEVEPYAKWAAAINARSVPTEEWGERNAHHMPSLNCIVYCVVYCRYAAMHGYAFIVAEERVPKGRDNRFGKVRLMRHYLRSMKCVDPPTGPAALNRIFEP